MTSMHIHTGSHLLDLDVPGLPIETRDEVLRQWKRLHETKREWEMLCWPAKDALNEPQYAIRRSNAPNREERRMIVIYQLWRRCEFVCQVLLWDHISKLRKSARSELKEQLVGLQPLLTDRADDDPLVSFCTALACGIEPYKHLNHQPLPLLDGVKDLPKKRLLYSVRQVYEAITKGNAAFWSTFHPSILKLIPATDDFSPADRTLADVLERCFEFKLTYDEALRLYHQAKSNLNEPQFVERLEAAACAGDEAAEEKAQQDHERAECVYQTVVEQLNRWREKRLQLQHELSVALDRALAVPRCWDFSPRDFSAMINCIHAKGIMECFFYEREVDYQKILPEIKKTIAKPKAYVARIVSAA